MYVPTSKMKAFCFIPLLGISSCYGLSVGQTIKTSSGPVRGHVGTVESDVSTYLGIPYALPPVGNLRFMPPEKYYGDKLIDGSSVVSFPHILGYLKVYSNFHLRDSLVQPTHPSPLVATISIITICLLLI